MNRQEMVKLIESDDWMMKVLRLAKILSLPDWYVGAGFIRSKVWDHLHNYSTRTPVSDVDLIYFDKNDFTEDEAGGDKTKMEAEYEKKLSLINPNVIWEVTNQARTHLFHGHKPYSTSDEGMSQWVETATCIGVRLNEENKLILSAPWGIDDLVNLVLRPTPGSGVREGVFEERVEKKGWLKKWPKLKIVK